MKNLLFGLIILPNIVFGNCLTKKNCSVIEKSNPKEDYSFYEEQRFQARKEGKRMEAEAKKLKDQYLN